MPVRKYVYDGDAVLQETDGAGATLTEYTRTGGGYGDLLSAYDGTSAKYYEPDALGSTDALADQSQAVVDRWAYRAFGTATQTTGTDSTPFTWVGRQGYFNDSQTGLYLLGSGTRFYDPATAQFLSRDPIGLVRGGANLQRYAKNSPIVAVDPSGLYTALCVWGDGSTTAKEKIYCDETNDPDPWECCREHRGARGPKWKLIKVYANDPGGPKVTPDCDTTCKSYHDYYFRRCDETYRRTNLPMKACCQGVANEAEKACESQCLNYDPEKQSPAEGAEAFIELFKTGLKECNALLKYIGRLWSLCPI